MSGVEETSLGGDGGKVSLGGGGVTCLGSSGEETFLIVGGDTTLTGGGGAVYGGGGGIFRGGGPWSVITTDITDVVVHVEPPPEEEFSCGT